MTTCAMCAQATATVYCLNDDASLCATCDTKFHANPLAARHQRRPLPPVQSATACITECLSNSAEDVAVVPQCGDVPEIVKQEPDHVATFTAANIFDDMFPFAPSFVEPANDDSPGTDFLSVEGPDFPSVEDITADILDFDCVVPNLSSTELADSLLLESEPFFLSLAAPIQPMIKAEALGGDQHYAANAVMVPQMAEPTFDEGMMEDDESFEDDASDDEYRITTRRPSARSRREPAATPPSVFEHPQLTREQRVARYKEKRARRNFRKTIRYQSRKAYAEIRPRIKGRFVSPEEYAAYMSGGTEAVVPASC